MGGKKVQEVGGGERSRSRSYGKMRLMMMRRRRMRRRRKIWELGEKRGKWRRGNVGGSGEKSIRVMLLNKPGFYLHPCLVSSNFKSRPPLYHLHHTCEI